MDLGVFFFDEDIKIHATCHRFESGEEYNATVEVVIGLQGEDYVDGDDYAMIQVTDETGLYKKEFTAGSLPRGKYWAVVNAVIDTVNVRQHYHFRVDDRPMWLLGMF